MPAASLFLHLHGCNKPRIHMKQPLQVVNVINQTSAPTYCNAVQIIYAIKFLPQSTSSDFLQLEVMA